MKTGTETVLKRMIYQFHRYIPLAEHKNIIQTDEGIMNFTSQYRMSTYIVTIGTMVSFFIGILPLFITCIHFFIQRALCSMKKIRSIYTGISQHWTTEYI